MMQISILLNLHDVLIIDAMSELSFRKLKGNNLVIMNVPEYKKGDEDDSDEVINILSNILS